MFAVVDVVELLRHWQAGDNVSQMARALGLDRKTVRKHVGRAAAAGLVPRAEAVRGRASLVHGEIAPSATTSRSTCRRPRWPPSTSACATSTVSR
jgi:predicted ArsR family transcriptional regulator